MGDNDEYAQGFYDAVTPVWEAFTFDDGNLCAVFCHVFGVRVQRIFPAVYIERSSEQSWRMVQEWMIESCAQHLAGAL